MYGARAIILGVVAGAVLATGGFVGAQFLVGSEPPVPEDTIVYESTSFEGLDPFVEAASLSGCEPEDLLAQLGADEAILEAWAEVLSLPPANAPTYLRSLQRSKIGALDHPRTDHGYADGEAYGYHALLEPGTDVLVEEDGAPVVRCISGSPLTPPECPPNCKPEPSPSPEVTPTPTPTPRRTTGGGTTTRREPPPTAAPTPEPPPPTPAPTPPPTPAPTPQDTGLFPG